MSEAVKRAVRSEASKRDWKPVRQGRIYCAPACGGRCTWAEYQLACAAARSLVSLLGPGWKSHVHENLGWHFEALYQSGGLSVCPVSRTASKQTWFAFLGESVGESRWTGTGETPKKAVVEAINHARAELYGIQKLVALVEGAV